MMAEFHWYVLVFAGANARVWGPIERDLLGVADAALD